MEKITQIWEIKFACQEKKYLKATSIDDALQRARDWSQEEMDRMKKKEGENFDENAFASDFDVEGVNLFVETDI